jgi:hypothetical protein
MEGSREYIYTNTGSVRTIAHDTCPVAGTAFHATDPLQATATARHIHIVKSCMHIFIRSGLYFRAQRLGGPFVASQEEVVLRTGLKTGPEIFSELSVGLQGFCILIPDYLNRRP